MATDGASLTAEQRLVLQTVYDHFRKHASFLSLRTRWPSNLNREACGRRRMTRSLCRACRPRCVRHGRMGAGSPRLPELAFCLPAGGDNAGISAYVKPCSAVTCGFARLMLNVQLAARFAPVMHPDPA